MMWLQDRHRALLIVNIAGESHLTHLFTFFFFCPRDGNAIRARCAFALKQIGFSILYL